MASPEDLVDEPVQPPEPAPQAETGPPPGGDSADVDTGDNRGGGGSSPVGVADVEVSVVGGEDSPVAASAGSSLESSESMSEGRLTHGGGRGGGMGRGVTSGLVEEEDDGELSGSFDDGRCVAFVLVSRGHLTEDVLYICPLFSRFTGPYVSWQSVDLPDIL